MRKFFKGICALALVAGLSYPAYAEVQNVKVSGDITARSFYKADYDLRNASAGDLASGTADDTSFSATFTRVGINADLTDNVATEVSLANQRLWAYEATVTGAGDIDLQKANVMINEFFYAPLSVKVGLQELQFGNGLLVGPGLVADTSSGVSSGTSGSVGFQGAQEFSIFNSYDAILAKLDFDPWSLSTVYAKVTETVRNNRDKTLFGVNAGYRFGSYNAEAEVYWFFLDDENWNLTLRQHPNDPGTERNWEENEVHALGLRGSVEPISQLSLRGEVAFQTGEIRDDIQDGGPSPAVVAYPYVRDRKAFALDVAGEYAFDMVYSPTFGLGWVTYTGEEADAQGTGDLNGDYQAWDQFLTSAYYGLIQSHFAGFDGTGIYGTQDPNDTVSLSNRHLLRVFGSAIPLDALTVDVEWIRAWFEEKPVGGRDDLAGDEVDLTLTYDYSEDVELGLVGAWFLPGDYYDGETTAANRSADTATLVMGTVSVNF